MLEPNSRITAFITLHIWRDTMLVVFDYRCPVCGQDLPDCMIRKDARPPICDSGHPTVDMVRKPAAPVTHFRFADKKLKR